MSFQAKVLSDIGFRYPWLLNENTSQKQPGAKLDESHYAVQQVLEIYSSAYCWN